MGRSGGGGGGGGAEELIQIFPQTILKTKNVLTSCEVCGATL